ncbi:MAG: UDP-N-acetylmuramate dehydrogenase [Saprospiraceae bacterium]
MHSLKEYNSFGIDAVSKELIIIKDLSDIIHTDFSKPYRILGAGSNVLLLSNSYDRILVNELKGIQIVDETDQDVTIQVASGENWHEFVMWSVSKNFSGIENLSLIPGTVGAAPVQNIGAYGVELKDVLLSVEGYFLPQKTKKVFSIQECDLGYRSSLFKTTLKNQFFISGITLKLSKIPIFKLEYGNLKETLAKKGIYKPTIQDISMAVIEIRQSKLPDPKKIGNAGSFFKNSSIPKIQFDILKSKFPEMPGYPDHTGLVKLSSGWLIEQCGWKGKQLNQAACYEKQALVLVKLGQATGQDILQLANKIQGDVFLKFGLHLEPEVNLWYN